MTNEAALGYMIIAARAAGLEEKIIKNLESEMQWAFDMKTESEAEESYRESGSGPGLFFIG
jgi:hypothetical protein